MGMFFKDKISDGDLERVLFRALASIWNSTQPVAPTDESLFLSTVDRLLSAGGKKLGPGHAESLRAFLPIVGMAPQDLRDIVQQGVQAARLGSDRDYVKAVDEFGDWLRSHGLALGPAPSLDDIMRQMRS